MEVLGTYTSILFVGVAAFLFLHWMLEGRADRTGGAWWPAQGVFAALVAPFVLFNLLKVAAGAHVQDHAGPLLYVPFVFWSFAHGFSLGPSVAELHAADKMAAFVKHWPAVLALGVLYGLVAVFVLRYLWHKPTRLFYLLGLIVPLAFVSAALEVTGSSVIPRYVMMCVPIFWLLLAAALSRGEIGRLRSLLVALLVGVNVYALFQLQFDARYHKEDYRSVERLISQQAPDLPVLAVGPVGAAAVVLRYYGLDSAQEVPDAATGAGARGQTNAGHGYWVVADGARAWAWDPGGSRRQLAGRSAMGADGIWRPLRLPGGADLGG